MNNLIEAKAIILEYSKPSEQGSGFVDSGNLYFAATEYKKAYEKAIEALIETCKQEGFRKIQPWDFLASQGIDY